MDSRTRIEARSNVDGVRVCLESAGAGQEHSHGSFRGEILLKDVENDPPAGTERVWRRDYMAPSVWELSLVRRVCGFSWDQLGTAENAFRGGSRRSYYKLVPRDDTNSWAGGMWVGSNASGGGGGHWVVFIRAAEGFGTLTSGPGGRECDPV